MADLSGSRIDHLNIPVTDLPRSVAFYEPVLATLGITTLLAVPADAASGQKAMHGLGQDRKPFLWLVEGGVALNGDTHIGLTADDRATVRRFYETALANGATPREAPGLHPEYHPDYFGGFVNDPDGINLEAVCHHPES